MSGSTFRLLAYTERPALLFRRCWSSQGSLWTAGAAKSLSRKLVPEALTLNIPSKYIYAGCRICLALVYKEFPKGSIPVAGSTNGENKPAFILEGYELQFKEGACGKIPPAKFPIKKPAGLGALGNQGDPGVPLAELYIPKLSAGKKPRLKINSITRLKFS